MAIRESLAMAQRYFKDESANPLKYFKGTYWMCYSLFSALKIGPSTGEGIEKRTLR
jgi:hypothetical protein